MGKNKEPKVKNDPIPLHISGIKHGILNASLQTFIHCGYMGFTFNEVSKEAGISRQRILYHYPTPEDVLLDLTTIWAERGRIIALEHLARITTGSIGDKIVGISDAMFLWMKEYPDLARLSPSILHAAHHSHKIRGIYSKAMELGRARIADLIELENKNRGIAEEKAKAIHGIIHGAGLMIVQNDDWSNLELHRRSVEFSIRNLLNIKEFF